MKFSFLGALLLPLAAAWSDSMGLNQDARDEIIATGLNKYLGEFTPIPFGPVGSTGWTKYGFDPDYSAPPQSGGVPRGPVCISGSPYAVYVRVGRDPTKVVIFLQGGGACWQDKYMCFPTADSADQVPPYFPRGIGDFDNDDNPFKDYTVVSLPYCDGSVFVGDNDVQDQAWADFILEQSGGSTTLAPIRYHRGIRNLSAGLDLAKALFPNPSQLVLSGSSAGGVGAQAFSPALARLLWGNRVDLLVLNDVGPIMSNLEDKVGLAARANDWQFGQFYTESCVAQGCDPLGTGTEPILYQLENDSTVRHAFYETDGDYTNRFGYMGYIPGVDSRKLHRDIIVEEHGTIYCAFPDRYRRFILSDDGSHGSLVPDGNLDEPDPFYTKTADEGGRSVVLNEWVDAFVNHRRRDWVDIVEDYVEVYPNAEVQDALFGAKCTNCWCKPEDGPDGECPELDNREFYGPDAIAKFKSYTPTGGIPTLNPPFCQPYPAVLAAASPPGTPACIPPESAGDHAVCAFVYDTRDCNAISSYRLETFENAHKAQEAGATVTHEGDCGVCSSAQDLAGNMDPQLDEKAFACAILINSGGPQAAVNCFVTDIGFTLDCAQLWVANTINTALPAAAGGGGCTAICIAFQQQGGPPNDPETCALNDCLTCDENASGDIFQQYSGRTRRRSGIMTAVIRDCNSIANIGQDPCPKKDPTDPTKRSKGLKGGRPKTSKGGSSSSDKCRDTKKGSKGGNGKMTGKGKKNKGIRARA